MSSVELPLVPSARSSNSSASSSRSHLYSAGSINSERSAQSLRSQRSQYEQENDDDDDDSAQSAEEEDQEEEPQESSGTGIWDEVEHFLNKPSPSLSNLSVKPAKTVNNPPKSTLPTLNGRRSSDNQTSLPSRPARASSTGTKTIDPKLLQEAFAYANQLQQQNFHDDDGNGEQQHQSWRRSKTKMLMERAAMGRTNSSSSSSSSNAVPSGPRPGRVGGARTSVNASTDARKKKGKTSTSAYSSAAKPKAALKKKRSTSEAMPSSADSDSKSKAKGYMDPQTLQFIVNNFQNGTALDELRRELAASQQSMAISRQVLQEAAQTFFHSH